MELNKNITFFLEDSKNDDIYLNNEEIINQMMNEFNYIDSTDDVNDVNNMNDIVSMKDLNYFIQKDLYCGNDNLYYNENYKLKDLMKICEYYGIAKNVKASKCKKQDIISTIIYFENSIDNYDIVLKRHKMWAYMTELLEDPKMKCFLLW
jgi:hypothetical protein